MPIKQISAFIENRRGSLARLTGALGATGVNIMALSVADAADYGIVRCVPGNAQRAVDALKSEGYTVRTTDVLAVCVPDAAGGLANVLHILEMGGVSVEYLYPFVRGVDGGALIAICVGDMDGAAAVLTENGVRLLTQEEVARL